MELFKILGKLSVSGVDKANRELGDVSKNGAKASSKLSKLSGVAKTVGKGILVGTGAAVTGTVGLIKSVSSSYGALQQSIGGVETLFKESSQTVIENANNAFTTAGISANDYMTQITSFSASLLQSVGGDTKKAADIGDMAIRDMADNANKMGTSMEDIQNAYQGFAKQNYTMLDNLKLGYGGTKGEMERLLQDAEKLSGQKYDISNLNDVYEAIHVVQQELGITGTTAKEADATVEGSFNSLSAAWQNFLAGLGNPDADMKKLVESLGQTLNTAVKNVTPIIDNMVQVLPAVVDSLVQSISDMLPTFITTFTQMTTNIINAIVQLLPEFIPLAVDCVMTVAQTLIQSIPQLVQAAFQLVQGLISALSQAAPQLIPTVVDIVMQVANTIVSNATLLIDAGMQLMLGLVNGVVTGIPQIIQQLPQLIDQIFQFITGSIPTIVDAGIQLFTSVVQALPQIIQAICDVLPQLVDGIAGGLIQCMPILIQAGVMLFVAIVKNLPQIIQTVVSVVPKLVAAIFASFGAVMGQIGSLGVALFTAIGNGMKTGFVSVKNFLAKLPQRAINLVKKIGTGVKIGINNLISFIKTLPSKIAYTLGFVAGSAVKFAITFAKHAKIAGVNFAKHLVNSIKNLPSNVAKLLTNTIHKVTTFATNFVAKAKSAGKNFVNGVVNFIKNLPSNIATLLSTTVSKAASFVKSFASKAREAGQQFLTTITTKVSEIPGQMLSIGGDIVRGIWNGIGNKIDWLKSQISGFVGKIKQGFKDALGIKSPSRVMRDEVGVHIADGVIAGINKRKSAAKMSAAELSKIYVTSAAKKAKSLKTANKLTLAQEVKFWTEVKKHCKKGTDAYRTATDNVNKSKQSLKKNLESVEKDFQTSSKKIKSNLESTLADLKSQYNDAVKSTKESIMSQYGLFDYAQQNATYDPATMKDNLQSQVDAMKKWNSDMNKLRNKGVDKDLIKELEEMGVAGAGNVEAILSMSDKELKAYNKLYKQKESLAQKEAIKENADLKKSLDKKMKTAVESANKQLDKLNSSFNKALKKLGVNAGRGSLSAGQHIVGGLKQGINTKKKDFHKFLTNFFKSISTTAKEALKIKSPSRVMAEIGDFVVQGMANGIQKNGNAVEQMKKKVQGIVGVAEEGLAGVNINTGIDDIGVESPLQEYRVDFNAQLTTLSDEIKSLTALVAQYMPVIADNSDKNLVLDSGALAVGLSRKMDIQLGKMAARKGRGNV